MAYAGIDIGTSGCKFIAYDDKGKELICTRGKYNEYGTDGYREVNGQEIWESVFETIKEGVRKCSQKIEAITIVTMGESIVCLNEQDKVLFNSVVTGDKRGIEKCEDIARKFSQEEIMSITGLPLNEMSALPTFIWMNENTDVFEKAQKILLLEDFISYKLTGNRGISYSSAVRTMALDINKMDWCDELLSLAGVDHTKFSKPVPSGTQVGALTEDMMEAFEINYPIYIIAGGHDQNCAALGSGLIHPYQAEDGHGTCEAMMVMLPRIDNAKYMSANGLSYLPYFIDDSYLTMLEVTTCGILMNWSRDTIFEGIKKKCEKESVNFFTYMDEKLKNEPSGLLVIPQFGSSGNPNINYDAKGLIWGLTIHTTPEEIYQAIKEGIAYQMLLSYELLEVFGVKPTQICITGGGAISEYTLQLRADMFNTEVIVMENKEAGTLGGAMIAAKSMGRFESYEEAVAAMTSVEKRYIPNKERHEQYMKLYEKYKKLYNTMNDFK